ncbi:MAG: hypothetical protein Q9220_003766 [cf. Caloplaca sp. 1 TL-2023]
MESLSSKGKARETDAESSPPPKQRSETSSLSSLPTQSPSPPPSLPVLERSLGPAQIPHIDNSELEQSLSSLESLSLSQSPSLPVLETSSEPAQVPHIDKFGLQQPPPVYNLEGTFSNKSRKTGRRKVYGWARELYPSHHVPWDYWQGREESKTFVDAFNGLIDSMNDQCVAVGRAAADASAEMRYFKDVGTFVNASCRLTEVDLSGRRRSLESRMEEVLKASGFDQVGVKESRIKQYEREKEILQGLDGTAEEKGRGGPLRSNPFMGAEGKSKIEPLKSNPFMGAEGKDKIEPLRSNPYVGAKDEGEPSSQPSPQP